MELGVAIMEFLNEIKKDGEHIKPDHKREGYGLILTGRPGESIRLAVINPYTITTENLDIVSHSLLISFLGQKKLDVYVKAKTNEIMNQIPTGEKTKNTTKLLSHFKSLERRFTSYYVATYLFPGQIEVKFDHLLYYRGIEPCEIRTVLDFERYEEEIREIENCYQTFMEEISEYAQKSGVNLLFGRANFMEKSEEKENDLRVIYWVRKNMFVKHGYMAAIEKKSFEGTLLEVTAWLIQNIKKEIGKKRLKPLLGD